MRGRKPKSTEEKVASGNPGKHRLAKNRPEPPTGNMLCPQWFNTEEREIWEEVIKTAVPGVLRPCDGPTIEAYVGQIALDRQAAREIRQIANDRRKPDGTTEYLAVETERGWVKNPLVTVRDTCSKNIKALASELALTPVSRERIGQKKEEEKSLRELLEGSWDSTVAKPN